MTATAPASSAIRACSTVVTSMTTPCFSMWAKPRFTRDVPATGFRSSSILGVMTDSGSPASEITREAAILRYITCSLYIGCRDGFAAKLADVRMRELFVERGIRPAGCEVFQVRLRPAALQSGDWERKEV